MAKSALFYVGMGCLGLTILGFGGCALVGFSGLNFLKQTFDQPVDEMTILKELGGVPKYPNAKFNETSTKLTRGVFKLISMTDKDKKALGGVFDITDSTEKVLGWYDGKMKEAGYTAIPLEKAEKLSKLESVTHQYEKGKEYVQVTMRKSDTEAKSNAQELVLLRFEGFTAEEVAEIGKDEKIEKAEKSNDKKAQK
jgi:hypothetical protein